MRFEYSSSSPHVPWFFKGEPAKVTGIELNGQWVEGVYISTRTRREFYLSAEEDGKFLGLEYRGN